MGAAGRRQGEGRGRATRLLACDHDPSILLAAPKIAKVFYTWGFNLICHAAASYAWCHTIWVTCHGTQHKCTADDAAY